MNSDPDVENTTVVHADLVEVGLAVGMDTVVLALQNIQHRLVHVTRGKLYQWNHEWQKQTQPDLKKEGKWLVLATARILYG